jgi:hypothetical protein
LDCGSSLLAGCVVIVQPSRLQQVHRNVGKRGKVFASNQWTGNEGDEDHQHDEVQDRETDNPSLSKLRLLERIDRGTDLTTMCSLVSLKEYVGK